jgi:hypothetical protein
VATLAVTNVEAAGVRLAPHSVDAMREKCSRNHGVFFDHGGRYGCALPRGVVQCNAQQQCVGYSKQRPVIHRPQPEYQWWHQDQQW